MSRSFWPKYRPKISYYGESYHLAWNDMLYHFPHNLDIWTKNKLFSHFCGLRSPSRSHADVKVILAKISTSNFLLEIQFLPYNLDIRK